MTSTELTLRASAEMPRPLILPLVFVLEEDDPLLLSLALRLQHVFLLDMLFVIIVSCCMWWRSSYLPGGKVQNLLR